MSNGFGVATNSSRIDAKRGATVKRSAHGCWYQLNNQVQAAQYAGQAVTVAGDFSNQKKTVDVAEMQLYKSSTTSAGVQ